MEDATDTPSVRVARTEELIRLNTHLRPTWYPRSRDSPDELPSARESLWWNGLEIHTVGIIDLSSRLRS